MLVELHSISSDTFYTPEAGARIYFYNFQGYPSLFMDGVDLWPISTWRPAIDNRITEPSPITLTISGSYNSSNNTGTVDASFQNDSTASIMARIYFVITEDSLYHLDPNGHAWHNHVARDFLPNEIGESVTISPGQTVTKSRNFTIASSWNENRCCVVTWLQADAPSRNVFQAGQEKIMNLIYVEEKSKPEARIPTVSLVTNPCVCAAVFAINLTKNANYQIEIFDISGRRVSKIKGITSQNKELVSWNLKDETGNSVSAGVFLYRFISPELSVTGKFVVH